MLAPIQILPAHQINCTKWDACIEKNENGLIYAQTRFLDTMADNWHGLVIGDYTTVMPIPWRKKWGIRYAYVPAFMQQQGFSGELNESELIRAMQLLTQWISYGDFNFNFSNTCLQNTFPAISCRNNQKIFLQKKYADLYQHFSSDAKRNIEQSVKENLQIETEWNEDIWNIFHQQMKYPHAPNLQEMQQFKQVCTQFASTNQCIIRWISNKEKQLLAAWVGLKDCRRIYNLLNLTTPLGRKTSANYFLINHLIQTFSEQPIWLDMEGSELPGVHSFYKNWGAQNETYFQLHLNQLPIPLRWIKR
jgi:hypothetical protein